MEIKNNWISLTSLANAQNTPYFLFSTLHRSTTSQHFALLHTSRSHKLPPSKYRVFCLSQCDKQSSFNNCLVDISCIYKRIFYYRFSPLPGFCLSAIVRSVIMSREEVKNGMKDKWVADVSDSLSAAHGMHKITRSSDFTDKALVLYLSVMSSSGDKVEWANYPLLDK